jgi:hypothetical protein
MSGSRWGTAGLVIAGLVVGCASAQPRRVALNAEPRIEATQLSGLSPDQLAEVNAQQIAVEEASGELEDARSSKADADEHVHIAQADLNAAQADYQRARTEAEIARRGYDQAVGPNAATNRQLLPMHAQRSDAENAALERMGRVDTDVRANEARADAESMKVDYIHAMAELSGSRVLHAEQQLGLERARLERARFTALARVRPDEARQLRVSRDAFDAAVTAREAELERATVYEGRMRAEAVGKYRTWVARGESQVPPGRERAMVPAPPRG